MKYRDLKLLYDNGNLESVILCRLGERKWVLRFMQKGSTIHLSRQRDDLEKDRIFCTPGAAISAAFGIGFSDVSVKKSCSN